MTVSLLVKNASHYPAESICIRQCKVQLTAAFVPGNSKLQLTCPLLLLDQESGNKLSDQTDFIRSLIKTPFNVFYSESKAVTSIEICHESSPLKKTPGSQNQDTADD